VRAVSSVNQPSLFLFTIASHAWGVLHDLFFYGKHVFFPEKIKHGLISLGTPMALIFNF
jgi:hypothetical protein